MCEFLILLFETVASGFAALEGRLDILRLDGRQLRFDLCRIGVFVIFIE